MRKNKVFITRKILEDGPNLLINNGLEIEIFPEDRPMVSRAILWKNDE